VRLFTQFYNTKSGLSAKTMAKHAKSRESLFRMVAKAPVVLNHNPSVEELEWNVGRCDRL